MVSEDDRWRSACADICLARRCNVHTASDGFQGLDNLRKHWYDVVILDDSMPDLSPFEFHLHLREIASNGPAVLVAGGGNANFARLDAASERVQTGSHASILEQIDPVVKEAASRDGHGATGNR